MLKGIDKRWKVQEQPLFIMAFSLDPTFRNTVVKLLHTKSLASGQTQGTCFVFPVSPKQLSSTTESTSCSFQRHLQIKKMSWIDLGSNSGTGLDTYEGGFWNDRSLRAAFKAASLIKKLSLWMIQVITEGIYVFSSGAT
jgi:hypothetical protein